jgi:hypothetical protein
MTWTAQSAKPHSRNGITWSGPQFVAVGFTGGVLTSPDGIAWKLRTTGYAVVDIIWTGTQFAAVGENGTILTSPDGETWTLQASGTTSFITDVTWSGTQFVAMEAGRTVLTSHDELKFFTVSILEAEEGSKSIP